MRLKELLRGLVVALSQLLVQVFEAGISLQRAGVETKVDPELGSDRRQGGAGFSQGRSNIRRRARKRRRALSAKDTEDIKAGLNRREVASTWREACVRDHGGNFCLVST